MAEVYLSVEVFIIKSQPNEGVFGIRYIYGNGFKQNQTGGKIVIGPEKCARDTTNQR